ncbi:TonB-dependent receptor [Shewanella intestini]|uniref:TonB-dependent receptor n=1 Tax=Shewanella intestini TaxID=2017544 RepID=A0ABS5HZW0_9GAMM|nr:MULTISPECIES: TonB-dependent receptor [Shewanella]MBR9727316.1 TonB-dependent receptor [Shewanella intestini]MRG35634.1 TonB-dependent receptor plug domain-containing protein [Shewanella sp. XMDDZSB0408]
MKTVINTVKVSTLALAISLSYQSAVQAAEKDTSKLNVAEVIVVHGERTPVTESANTQWTMNDEQIQATGAQRLDQVLKYIPGIYVRMGGKGTPRIDIRGFKSRHIIYLINGVPANEAEDGQFDPSLIPTSQIASVNVTVGPASVLYGTGGAGGVINIITKDGNKEPTVSGNMEMAENQTYNGSINVAGGGEKWQGLLNYSRQHTDGWAMSSDYQDTAHQQGDTRENTDRVLDNLYGQGSYTLNDDTKLFANFSYKTGEWGKPGRDGTSSGNVKFERVDDFSSTTAQLGFAHSFNDMFTLRGFGYVNESDMLDSTYQDETYNIVDAQQRGRSTMQGANVQFISDFGSAGVLTTAVIAEKQQWQSNTVAVASIASAADYPSFGYDVAQGNGSGTGGGHGGGNGSGHGGGNGSGHTGSTNTSTPMQTLTPSITTHTHSGNGGGNGSGHNGSTSTPMQTLTPSTTTHTHSGHGGGNGSGNGGGHSSTSASTTQTQPSSQHNPTHHSGNGGGNGHGGGNGSGHGGGNGSGHSSEPFNASAWLYTAAAEYQFQGDDYGVTIGAAVHDQDRKQASKTDYSAQASAYWQPLAQTKFNFGVARKVRFPSMTNLYTLSSGNADLKTEQSKHVELGLVQTLTTNTQLNVAGYYTDAKNYIAKDLNGMYQNMGRYAFKGADVQLQNNSIDNLSLRLTYSYLNTEDKDAANNAKTLQYSPENIVRFEANYLFPTDTSLHLNVERVMDQVFYAQDHVAGNQQIVKQSVADYTLVDMKLTQPVIADQLDVYIKATNLLDENYYQSEALPQAGRQVFVGVNFHI